MEPPVASSSSLNAEAVQPEHSNTEPAPEATPETEQNASQSTQEPPPNYPIYSWKSKSPSTRLVYIRDLATAELEVAKLQPGPVGFDLEWKPNRWRGANNPVALVQLATDDTILLIQVTAMRVFPEKLRQLLADPSYLKAGVGIQNDAKKLWADYAVNTRNCVDLALLARTVDNARWKGKYSQPIGLARLCQTYHNLDLTKGKITRSNWELCLDDLQQEYAANDCHSGLTLYLQLHGMMSALQPAPVAGYFTFDAYNGLLYHPSAEQIPTMLWQPHNPHYDPGPPPEPRVRKDPADKEGTNAVTSGEQQQAPASRNRGRRAPPYHQRTFGSAGPPGIVHPAQVDPMASRYNPPPQAQWQSMQPGVFGQPSMRRPPALYNTTDGYVAPPVRGRGRGRGGANGGYGGRGSRGSRGGRGGPHGGRRGAPPAPS
ncbi:hypothetical protein EIP86_009859 [Pleurotus ostreatoroseus]|nr:hypothetical protein EIP86_009859 [Pleurotus ostreatoroseus]